MLSRKLFAAVLTAALVSLSACMGDLPPSSTAQEYESNQRLLETYRPLTGLFKGELTENPNNEPNIPVVLEIFIDFDSSGRNEDGEERVVPVLKARYYRTDVENATRIYQIPSVRYYKESAQYVLRAPARAGSNIPGDGMISIDGRVENEIFIGRMNDHRGYQGVLRLKKVASAAPRDSYELSQFHR
jgi:hypothetical protein